VATKTGKKPFKGKWELYDLSVDRSEENNLIEKQPEIAAELEQKWDDWANANNVLPLDGRGWTKKVKSDINSTKK
jgi:arylsulfatase